MTGQKTSVIQTLIKFVILLTWEPTDIYNWSVQHFQIRILLDEINEIIISFEGQWLSRAVSSRP